jgi:4-amino-4-deoxy-L-arabinose transferase-like glycosyltransferase
MNSRVQALLMVLFVWAMVYLPALGSLAIKGEEGRRILPAIRMVETGNYIVPQVGSNPYFRKPPLVNWLVAASFKIFGVRNEWTARLPSALAVLAVAIAFITVARPSLGSSGSTIAAIIWLTNFGIIEKGRLIEIEALYVSLFGLALICWLAWWEQQRSPWLTWIVPWIFLGLGWLAKGPIHAIFFYVIVVAVLCQAGELRKFLNAPHAIGFIIMMLIFAAWAIPYVQIAGASRVAHVWNAQLWLIAADFRPRGWLLNIPRSLGYFLPWLLLLPLVGGATFSSESKTKITRALIWGIPIPLLVVNLIPGWLPRYGMPLLVPAVWLLAGILSAENLEWPRWLGGRVFLVRDRQRTVTAIAIATWACVCLYAFAVVPFLQKQQKVKAIAAQIDALVPASQPLYAVNPDFQPFLFYVGRRLIYVSEVDDLPSDVRYFLIQASKEREAKTALQLRPTHPKALLRIEDHRFRKTTLFSVGTPEELER